MGPDYLATASPGVRARQTRWPDRPNTVVLPWSGRRPEPRVAFVIDEAKGPRMFTIKQHWSTAVAYLTAVVALGAFAAPAEAAYTGSVSGSTATLTGDSNFNQTVIRAQVGGPNN